MFYCNPTLASHSVSTRPKKVVPGAGKCAWTRARVRPRLRPVRPVWTGYIARRMYRSQVCGLYKASELEVALRHLHGPLELQALGLVVDFVDRHGVPAAPRDRDARVEVIQLRFFWPTFNFPDSHLGDRHNLQAPGCDGRHTIHLTAGSALIPTPSHVHRHSTTLSLGTIGTLPPQRVAKPESTASQ